MKDSFFGSFCLYMCVRIYGVQKRKLKACAQNPQEANSPHDSLKRNGRTSVGQIVTLTAACCA